MKEVTSRGWGYSSVVECLSSICEALDFISNTPHEDEEEGGGRGGEALNLESNLHLALSAT
jgi:hypothetical protein